jgi:hypothetical protein
LTAGIHEVFRGSNFFSNAGVGEINKNLNIELRPPNLPSGGQILKIWTNGSWFLVTRRSLVTRSDPTLFYFAIIFSDRIMPSPFYKIVDTTAGDDTDNGNSLKRSPF